MNSPKCRCGHQRHEHGPTAEQLIVGTPRQMPWECRRCDCSGFHTTAYKKRTDRRNVAPRAGQRQMRLFEGGHR